MDPQQQQNVMEVQFVVDQPGGMQFGMQPGMQPGMMQQTMHQQTVQYGMQPGMIQQPGMQTVVLQPGMMQSGMQPQQPMTEMQFVVEQPGMQSAQMMLPISEPVSEVTAVLSCFNCNLNLTGYRYILRDEKPFCIKCYEQLFANKCEECKQPIGTDFKDLSYKEKHWHEKCFTCADCKTSLVDRPFACKNDKTYCPDCHDNNFALRCDACTNIFRAGMKKYEFKGKQFHEECFCCKVCRQPIGVKTFIPRDQEAVCVPCYEEQYAQRCVKCNGVINKGGITYKGTPWHRECFTCTGCNKMLVGEKFTSRDEKPYCAECFAQHFAKKCIRCNQPITGLGTTKFISFDDRHWHNDCFQCYKCNTSLVGRGFLVSGQDVLCPDCGRA